MIITKTANLLTNKVTFTIELDRPEGYTGIDVYPDERLAEILLAVSRKISKDVGNREIKAYATKRNR